MCCFFRFLFILALIGQGCLIIYDPKISSTFEKNVSNLQQVKYFGVATNYIKPYVEMIHLKIFFVVIHVTFIIYYFLLYLKALAAILIFKKVCCAFSLNILAFMFYIGIQIWEGILRKQKPLQIMELCLPNIVFLAGLFMIPETYNNSGSCCCCCSKGKNIRKPQN